MNGDCGVPRNPLALIRQCVLERRIFWTYHVNMRLEQRAITRDAIVGSLDSYEVIEAYPTDKYLPSWLIRAQFGTDVFHVLFALDVEHRNVRVVTAYRPIPSEWADDFRRRKRS